MIDTTIKICNIKGDIDILLFLIDNLTKSIKVKPITAAKTLAYSLLIILFTEKRKVDFLKFLKDGKKVSES